MTKRGIWVALTMGVTLCVGAGCSRPHLPRQQGAAMADTLAWGRAAGAQRYVVRGWSGDRLLFEVTTADTLLVLTPSMARAVAAFDTSSAEIVGQAGDRMVSWAWRRLRPRGEGAAVGAGGGT